MFKRQIYNHGSKSLQLFERKIMNGDVIKIVGYLDRNSDQSDTLTHLELKPVIIDL